MPVVFRVKLGKTGHSLKVTLPRPIIDGFGWKEGDEIVLLVSEQEVTLRRTGPEPAGTTDRPSTS